MHDDQLDCFVFFTVKNTCTSLKSHYWMFLAAAAQFSLTQLKKLTAVGFNGRYAVSSILAGPILYVSNICPTLVPRQED